MTVIINTCTFCLCRIFSTCDVPRDTFGNNYSSFYLTNTSPNAMVTLGPKVVLSLFSVSLSCRTFYRDSSPRKGDIVGMKKIVHRLKGLNISIFKPLRRCKEGDSI